MATFRRSGTTSRGSSIPTSQPVVVGTTDISGNSSSPFGRGTPEAEGYNIRLSSAYQEAYALFSGLSDKQWLSKLETIASRSAVGSESWTDALGLTQDFQQRQLEAYNQKLLQIQNLVSAYYAFVNSLPSTQVQQLADAGINSAVTGQGVSGSELDSGNNQISNLSGEGTNSVGVIGSAISSISTIFTTLSSVYQSAETIKNAKRGLDLTEDQFVATALRGLSDAGFTNLSGIGSAKDLVSWLRSSDDPEFINRSSDALVKTLNKSAHKSIYNKYIQADDKGNQFFNTMSFLQDVFGTDDLDKLDGIMSDYATYQFKSEMAKRAFDFYDSSYKAKFASGLDGELSAEAEVALQKMNKGSASYSAYMTELKSEFVSKFVEQFNSSKSPSDKFALMNILFDMDFDDQAFMSMCDTFGDADLTKLFMMLFSSIK